METDCTWGLKGFGKRHAAQNLTINHSLKDDVEIIKRGWGQRTFKPIFICGSCRFLNAKIVICK